MSPGLLADAILAGLARAEWSGSPIHYAVIDDVLPDAIAREAFEAFPPTANGFITRRSFREFKHTASNLHRFPALLADVALAMQDARVVRRIGELTGFDALEEDATFYAAGLSMMFKGQFLNPHIDNSHDGSRSRYRRLNLLYYLTPNWRPEFGGNLELWNPQVTRQVTIPPLFNRLVIMETHRSSWHSVSPVTVDQPRCCVSSYLFSKRSPTGETYRHVTSFTGRPDQRLLRVAGTLDNPLRQFAQVQLGLERRAG